MYVEDDTGSEEIFEGKGNDDDDDDDDALWPLISLIDPNLLRFSSSIQHTGM